MPSLCQGAEQEELILHPNKRSDIHSFIEGTTPNVFPRQAKQAYDVEEKARDATLYMRIKVALQSDDDTSDNRVCEETYLVSSLKSKTQTRVKFESEQ